LSDNQDDSYIVLPGYKFIAYNNYNYQTQLFIHDNTYGTGPYFQNMGNQVNQCSSCRLYYFGNEILIANLS
jgi:hypothetical protein